MPGRKSIYKWFVFPTATFELHNDFVNPVTKYLVTVQGFIPGHVDMRLRDANVDHSDQHVLRIANFKRNATRDTIRSSEHHWESSASVRKVVIAAASPCVVAYVP